MPSRTPPSASSAHSNLNKANRNSAAAVPRNRYWIYGSLALVGFLADLLTKNWIFGRLGMPHRSPPIWLWPDVLSLTTSLNEGALFGMGQGLVPVFAMLSLAAAAGIVYWLFWLGAAHDRLLTFALGSVTAGIFGNLYDRLGLHGLRWHFPPDRAGERVFAVRDWIHFKIDGVIDWPVFNLADSFLVCGVALLMLHAVFAPQSAQPADTSGASSSSDDASPPTDSAAPETR